MKNMKKSTSMLLGAALAASVIQGCGKSDATKDYKNLNLVAPYSDNGSTQKFFDKVMNISLVTDDTKKIPVFLEGEANEIKLTLKRLDPAITAAAMSIDGAGPDGSALTQSKTEPDIYIFSWTPRTGYIGAGPVQATTVNFVAHVVSGPSVMANFVSHFSLPIIVEHTQVRPKVISIDIPQVINEGVDQQVLIRVQDAAHSGVNQPDLRIVSYQGERNIENHKFDWASKLTPNQPLVSGPDKDGVFTYSYMMNLKGQTLPVPPSEYNEKKPDKNASIVNLCFTAIATSKISNLNGSKDQCTRVQFATQPPVAYFDGDPDGVIGSNSAIAGEAFTMNFEVKTPNGRGNIQNPHVTFVSFASDPSGKPKVEEIDKTSKAVVASGGPASADRLYKISWTPSCKATGSYNVKIHLANSLDGVPKTADLTRKIMISSKSSSCDAAPATPAKTAKQ